METTTTDLTLDNQMSATKAIITDRTETVLSVQIVDLDMLQLAFVGGGGTVPDLH